MEYNDGYMTLKEASASMPEAERMSWHQLRKMCLQRRIKGARKAQGPRGERWEVPVGFKVEKSQSKWGGISEAKKNMIARAYQNGRTGAELSNEYDIDQSYPRQLVKRGYPKD